MATYTVNLTHKNIRSYTITVPDNVPEDDVKEWVAENSGDLWDVERGDGTARWDLDDLVDDANIEVSVICTLEDDVLDVEDVYVE